MSHVAYYVRCVENAISHQNYIIEYETRISIFKILIITLEKIV